MHMVDRLLLHSKSRLRDRLCELCNGIMNGLISKQYGYGFYPNQFHLVRPSGRSMATSGIPQTDKESQDIFSCPVCRIVESGTQIDRVSLPQGLFRRAAISVRRNTELEFSVSPLQAFSSFSVDLPFEFFQIRYKNRLREYEGPVIGLCVGNSISKLIYQSITQCVFFLKKY